METLSYSPIGKECRELIMIDKIVRFSKSNDGEITYIHLINGEVIETEDSINTIETRINSKSQ